MIKAGGQESRKGCRRAEIKVDRQTEVQKDRCTNIHTDNQKKRRTDIHRQTDRQTDSAKVLEQAEKQTDVQKDRWLTE